MSDAGARSLFADLDRVSALRLACLPLSFTVPPRPPRSLTPEYMWAERKDTVHLTLNVPNPVEDTAACSLTPEGRVVWVGTGGPADTPHRYRLDIQLMGAVDVAAAKKAVGARAVVFRLPKATSGYWGKLTEKKDLHCRVDWSMWKDEDEEEEFDFGTLKVAAPCGLLMGMNRVERALGRGGRSSGFCLWSGRVRGPAVLICALGSRFAGAAFVKQRCADGLVGVCVAVCPYRFLVVCLASQPILCPWRAAGRCPARPLSHR